MKALMAAILAAVLLCQSKTLGKRIKDSIYTNLQESAFCFRRTNGTSQMGCAGDFSGNVGVVQLIADDSDISWLLNQGSHDPYVGKISS